MRDDGASGADGPVLYRDEEHDDDSKSIFNSID